MNFSAHYREAANIFVILDCVSQWWDGFCADDGAYRKGWLERFKLSSEDLESFKTYDQIRRRYYRGEGLPAEFPGPSTDGIFAKRAAISEDTLAPAFYSSKTLPEALQKAAKVVSAEDLDFLKAFYDRFRERYTKLLEESKAFVGKAAKVDKQLKGKKPRDFFPKISRFYKVDQSIDYEILFMWFPPLKRNLAFPADRYLLMLESPVEHIDVDSDEVIFHEVVHTISARQPQEQKTAVSKAFLDECPVFDKFPKGRRSAILEEALAVVIGQVLYLKENAPERLKWEQNLYRHPWVNSFSRQIYPLVEEEISKPKGTLSAELGKKLGKVCKALTEAAEFIGKPGS